MVAVQHLQAIQKHNIIMHMEINKVYPLHWHLQSRKAELHSVNGLKAVQVEQDIMLEATFQ